MVRLNVKHGDENQFLYDTVTTIDIDSLVHELLHLYNGRLKIERLCTGMHVLGYTCYNFNFVIANVYTCIL